VHVSTTIASVAPMAPRLLRIASALLVPGPHRLRRRALLVFQRPFAGAASFGSPLASFVAQAVSGASRAGRTDPGHGPKLSANRSARPALVGIAFTFIGGCKTDPPTGVTYTQATLNASAYCEGPGDGYYWYEGAAPSYVAFHGVGWLNYFNCTGPSGWTKLVSQVWGPGLSCNTQHVYRLGTTKAAGQPITYYDANGTQNGAVYHGFVTSPCPPMPTVQQVAEDPPEQFISDPDGLPIASGCRVKEIKNPRRGHSTLGTHLWTVRLTTAWKYCNGDIVKMYPAGSEFWTTSAGAVAGWRCLHQGTKIRAINTGGNPEHGAYTYAYDIEFKPPYSPFVLGVKHWCATNQISGSGAHRRHGSCDIQPW
jgi:hypothetical protein